MNTRLSNHEWTLNGSLYLPLSSIWAVETSDKWCFTRECQTLMTSFWWLLLFHLHFSWLSWNAYICPGIMPRYNNSNWMLKLSNISICKHCVYANCIKSSSSTQLEKKCASSCIALASKVTTRRVDKLALVSASDVTATDR